MSDRDINWVPIDMSRHNPPRPPSDPLPLKFPCIYCGIEQDDVAKHYVLNHIGERLPRQPGIWRRWWNRCRARLQKGRS